LGRRVAWTGGPPPPGQ